MHLIKRSVKFPQACETFFPSFSRRKRDVRRKGERGTLQIHVQSSDEHRVATIIALKVVWEREGRKKERKKERKKKRKRFPAAER